jgi:hypothetical protein
MNTFVGSGERTLRRVTFPTAARIRSKSSAMSIVAAAEALLTISNSSARSVIHFSVGLGSSRAVAPTVTKKVSRARSGRMGRFPAV